MAEVRRALPWRVRRRGVPERRPIHARFVSRPQRQDRLSQSRHHGRDSESAIRANPDFRGLKVYAISGTSPDALGVVRGPQGVDRWFPKPLNPEVLVRELSRELKVMPA